MRVFLYSDMRSMKEKSDSKKAIYHQQFAAKLNGIGQTREVKDADVIHINTVFPRSFLLVKKAKRRQIPVIYHVHLIKIDLWNTVIDLGVFRLLLRKWMKYCYNLGTIIVTPTKYTKKLLQSYGIKRPIEVISNGVDLVYYDKKNVDPMSFRRKYGYGSKEKIIICVGCTTQEKEVSDFVELAKGMPEYEFIWFEEGNLNTRSCKTKEVVQTKLPNLKFAREVKPNVLRDAYGSCDLFLHLSKEETEESVILEALAMEIPILLWDIPVYMDWLEEDREVYKAQTLQEFQAKVKKILEQECIDLTKDGLLVAKARSIERVGGELGQVYKGCMEQRQL